MSAPDLSSVFPPSPTSVPPGLTAPTKAYKRHAWLAMGGLLSFVGLYLGLTGYLAWSVWRLLGNALLHGGNVVGAAFLSLPALFFLAFLVRGLFIVKRGADSSLVELKPADQPTLFAFLYKLADETGAPRPHKVFLSGRVNAGVFYDLSFLNLLFPSKKNLELGLGLVNSLSLDEFKAVLAHEYGHFAQKTMAVGRWVYLAEQIAGHIVMSRGIFDRFLTGISRIDIRVAWIGWILRLFVWAIRAVLDSAFRIVVLAHRALGREMEFNADRVAVSVSGSDSLVHALHRLGPADEAWQEAVSFSAEELHSGREVKDLFALQTLALEHLRRIFDEPDFGKSPQRPDGDSSFRVFDAGLAQPPRMWLTHPPNREREDSAKELYLPSPLDARPAWALFANVDQVRAEVTTKLFQKAKEERAKNSAGAPTPTPVETTMEERFAKRFSRAALDPRYRGVYLGRSIAAYEEKPDALIGDVEALDHQGVLAALESLYPASLRSELKSYRDRREEELQLEGLADGVLTAPGGVIRYRGREIRRKELRGVIEAVRTERRSVEQRILDHDRTCRATHLAAANLVGNGWSDHLQGLVELMHFVSHSLRNLVDAHSHLHHVLDIVLADGNVSSAERARVLHSADDLFVVITRLWEAKKSLVLPDDVDEVYEAAGGFTALSEELGLLGPNEGNLGDWLRVMEGWAGGAIGDLRVLADVTLDRLLEVEDQVAKWVRDGGEVDEAPEAAVVPAKYATCVVGKERERQKRLGWWDRFQTADGVVPGTLRAAVASGVLLPALFVSGHIGSSTVHVVNGLNVPVKIVMEERAHVVPASSTDRWELDPSGDVQVKTTLLDGTLVEQFEVGVGGGFSHALYDVASAAALVEWTAVYGAGGNSELPDVPLGAPRWSDAPQDYFFVQPPRSISLKRGQTAYKRVLEAPLSAPAASQLTLVKSADERRDLLVAHITFDEVAESFGSWAAYADEVPEVKAALVARAKAEPSNVFLQRSVQDLLEPAEREAQCASVAESAKAMPDDGDLAYLSLRCAQANGGTADYAAAWKAHPQNPWLNWAVAEDLASRGEWKQALAAFDVAEASKAFAPMRNASLVEHLRVYRGARAAGLGVPMPRSITMAPKESTVAFLQRVEGAAQKDDWPFLKAYHQLRAGNLFEANRELLAGQVSETARARIHLLVGASDGASEAQVKDALEVLPPPDLAWVDVALSIREGQSVDTVGEAVPGLRSATEREALAAVLSDEGLVRATGRLEAIAKPLLIRDRAVVLAMGIIVLKDKAPTSWRSEVKELLFTIERPYFR